MATVVETFAIEGIEGYRVEIEASSIKGVPSLSIVGLPDQLIKESGDRVESAITYCGYKFPAIAVRTNPRKRSARLVCGHVCNWSLHRILLFLSRYIGNTEKR